MLYSFAQNFHPDPLIFMFFFIFSRLFALSNFQGMYQLEHQKMVDSLAIVKVKMPSLLLKLQKHAASLTAAAAKKSNGGSASSVPVPLSPMVCRVPGTCEILHVALFWHRHAMHRMK